MLTTPNFENRCAHLNTPEKDSDTDCCYDWIGTALNNNDKKALKAEILSEGSPVSGWLKKVVEQLDI